MPTPWSWRAVPDQSTPVASLIRILNRSLSELSRELLAVRSGVSSSATFPDLATTPSVRGARLWQVINTAPTSITALTGGTAGQEVLIWATTANTTLVHSASLLLKGGVNVLMTATETRRFATVDGLNWREV